MTEQELNRRFDYHPPSGSQTEIYQEMRKKFKELAKFIVENTPENREKYLAITKLEEGQFFANASIARNI